MTAPPGDLIASRVTVLPSGDVAQVVITERTGPYAVRLREAYARWFGDGAWSVWRLTAGDVHDVDIAADTGQEEESALISAVIWVPMPAGVVAKQHALYQPSFYRLTASGVSRADL